MSLKVIEFNDSALTVGDESGVLAQSPGFALAVGKSLELGDLAEQQARLQPTSSYNKYWHELSMEPLRHSNGIRHFADIAYAHLLHLAEIANVDGDVIFAVPGNFTRQQLAILLGLAKQSPITPVGVVDSALVAAIAEVNSESLIYADIQLHQVVLTKLLVSDGELKTDSVIQVPGVGSQNFMDSMMQLATDMFIQQCRFNPQHNAESEQQLYNELPNWLSQDDGDKSSLLLELKTASAAHTAKMPRESLINHLSGYHQKIAKQIAALCIDHNSRVLVSSGLAALPGFMGAMNIKSESLILPVEAISAACLNYREQIISGADNIHLVSSLQLSVADERNTESQHREETPQVKTTQEVTTETIPTHVLYANRATRIALSGGVKIQNQAQLNGSVGGGRDIVMALAGLPTELGRIEQLDGEIWIDSGELNFQLNQQQSRGRQKLNTGDRISFSDGSDVIRLIQVTD